MEFIDVSVRPNKPGYLIITGISWNFLDIPCRHMINYDNKNQSKIKSANFFNRF